MSDTTKTTSEHELTDEPSQPDAAVAAPSDTKEGEPELPAAEASKWADWTREDLETELDSRICRIAQLEEETEALDTKVEAGEREIQRMAAEFQNARKRLDRTAQERIDNASQSLAEKFLPVLDDLELALGNVPAEVRERGESFVQGVQHIHGKIQGILANAGIEPMEPSGLFDPNLHEAMQQIPSEDHESGEIIEVMRTGYRIRDKVLRPAMVRVAA